MEKLIREQFGVLMYQDGKGQVINRAEYLRWKFRDLKQVSARELELGTAPPGTARISVANVCSQNETLTDLFLFSSRWCSLLRPL